MKSHPEVELIEDSRETLQKMLDDIEGLQDRLEEAIDKAVKRGDLESDIQVLRGIRFEVDNVFAASYEAVRKVSPLVPGE